eukprot:SAG31_NODE_3099_length_4677_cov_15.742246_2_plen_98_part_00
MYRDLYAVIPAYTHTYIPSRQQECARLCVVSAMAPRAGHLNGDAGGCAKRWGGARVHSWHDPIGEIGRNAATNRWGHRLHTHLYSKSTAGMRTIVRR